MQSFSFSLETLLLIISRTFIISFFRFASIMILSTGQAFFATSYNSSLFSLHGFLVCSGLSPTIITGGIMNNFGQNIYLTDSNYVVVEADESDGTVFKINPKILIYLNGRNLGTTFHY